MAVHFHELKVKQVFRETADCISVSFDIPEELRSEFMFKEGQNITLKKTINGEELRRSYSICSAPFENELKVAIKKVTGGAFSAYANLHLKAGDLVEVLPPTGKFASQQVQSAAKNYLAIAAGSGITPVISIIKQTLFEHPENRFTLIYGNQNRSSIIFFEELEGIKNKFMGRFQFIHVLSREKTDALLNYGRIDANKLEALKSIVQFSDFDDIFICGPEGLIFGSEAFLLNLGIEKSKIHFELFTTPGQKIENRAMETKLVETGAQSRVTIKLDGRSFEFNLAYNGEAILDAALQQGADLPYACKGGVCCTCRAKLVQGEVKMDVNYALEDEEVAQGFILTCQSHPLTENVIVDFDVK